MADNMHLIGADDVRAAGNRMQSAAEDIKRAAGQIDASVDRLQRIFDDFLNRLESIMAPDE